MSYFDTEEYGRKPSKVGYFLVAIIGAIIGGLLSLYLAPVFYGGNLMDNNPILNQPQTPQISNTEVDFSPVVAIAEQVGPTVVGVSNRGRVSDFFGRTTVTERGSGSGVIIDSRGYIVTNYHVIDGASEIIVTLADGEKVEAKLVGADQQTDLAVLKIEADNLPVAVLGDSTKLRTGELVVAIGNPLGIEFARSVTMGVVSATERKLTIGDQQFNLIQTDAAINPGNSGGALVNSRGEVIGINSAKLVIEGVEGMGFAIPISEARPIIEELIEKGEKLKNQMLASDGYNYLLDNLTDAMTELKDSFMKDEEQLSRKILNILDKVSKGIDGNSELREDIDTVVIDIAGELVALYGDKVGALIYDTMNSWEVEDMVDKLEVQVGADLQYI